GCSTWCTVSRRNSSTRTQANAKDGWRLRRRGPQVEHTQRRMRRCAKRVGSGGASEGPNSLLLHSAQVVSLMALAPPAVRVALEAEATRHRRGGKDHGDDKERLDLADACQATRCPCVHRLPTGLQDTPAH